MEQAGTTSKEPDEVEEAVNGVEVLTDEVNVLVIASSATECENFDCIIY